jgi:hypothetical protein
VREATFADDGDGAVGARGTRDGEEGCTARATGVDDVADVEDTVDDSDDAETLSFEFELDAIIGFCKSTSVCGLAFDSDDGSNSDSNSDSDSDRDSKSDSVGDGASTFVFGSSVGVLGGSEAMKRGTRVGMRETSTLGVVAVVDVVTTASAVELKADDIGAGDSSLALLGGRSDEMRAAVRIAASFALVGVRIGAEGESVESGVGADDPVMALRNVGNNETPGLLREPERAASCGNNEDDITGIGGVLGGAGLRNDAAARACRGEGGTDEDTGADTGVEIEVGAVAVAVAVAVEVAGAGCEVGGIAEFSCSAACSCGCSSCRW